MNEIILKINQKIERYFIKYKTMPNAIIINEGDLWELKFNSFPYLLDEKSMKEKPIYQICGLKVIPIKYGEMQVVEVIE